MWVSVQNANNSYCFDRFNIIFAKKQKRGLTEVSICVIISPVNKPSKHLGIIRLEERDTNEAYPKESKSIAGNTNASMSVKIIMLKYAGKIHIELLINIF